MSKDNGKNPNPNNSYKNLILNNQSKGLIFNAFKNLRLHCNNNFTLGESSNNNEQREPCNNNLNLSVKYNIGKISYEGSGFPCAPPPSWITQPGQNMASSPQSFARPNITKPDLENVHNLLSIMTCPTRYSEFQTFLERIDTYEKSHKVKFLFAIGSTLATNRSTFLHLATNQYGSQYFKTLLKRNPSLYGLIYNTVCINFSVLMNSKFSPYLIVETIRAVDRVKKEKLYELTYTNALFLATKETGCIALNNVFQEIKGKFREGIFHLVALNADRLAFDPYGTHVVQNFVTLRNPYVNRKIVETLYGSFFKLAMGRQGSYLVEKCLRTEQGREMVLDEFRRNDREWVRMAKHWYGNFVAQCALMVMKEKGMRELLREFVDKLRPHFGDKKNGHGRNTLKVIEEEIEEYLFELPYNIFSFMS